MHKSREMLRTLELLLIGPQVRLKIILFEVKHVDKREWVVDVDAVAQCNCASTSYEK